MKEINVSFDGNNGVHFKLALSREDAEGLVEALEEEGVEYTWKVLEPELHEDHDTDDGLEINSIFGHDEDGYRLNR